MTTEMLCFDSAVLATGKAHEKPAPSILNGLLCGPKLTWSIPEKG